MELADRWIYSRLNEIIQTVSELMENVRMNDAASLLMDFIWKEFCSWYLELAKDRIYNENDKAGQITAKYILLDVFQTSMRLLQPFMPFICEEIWQGIREHFPLKSESIVIAAFPKSVPEMIDTQINADMKLIQDTIVAIRNLRKQVNLAPGKTVDISVKLADSEQKILLNNYRSYFTKLAKVKELHLAVDLVKPASSIAAVVQNLEIYLPLEGLLDLEKEKQKLKKQYDKLNKELKGISAKLHNEKFLTNAPENIIVKEREKYEEILTKLKKTEALITDLK
jgi:valyl-tRNA synthetase